MATKRMTLQEIKELLRPVVEVDGAKIKSIAPSYTWSDTPAMGDYQYCNGIEIELEEDNDLRRKSED